MLWNIFLHLWILDIFVTNIKLSASHRGILADRVLLSIRGNLPWGKSQQPLWVHWPKSKMIHASRSGLEREFGFSVPCHCWTLPLPMPNSPNLKGLSPLPVLPGHPVCRLESTHIVLCENTRNSLDEISSLWKGQLTEGTSLQTGVPSERLPRWTPAQWTLESRRHHAGRR